MDREVDMCLMEHIGEAREERNEEKEDGAQGGAEAGLEWMTLSGNS